MPDIAYYVLHQRHEEQKVAGVDIGKLVPPACHQGRHLRFGRFECDAGRETRDPVAVVARASRCGNRRVDRGGPPHGEVPRPEVEPFGHHADNLYRSSVEEDRPAHHAGIPAEPGLPEVVLQDRHRWSVRGVVVVDERAAEQRRNAQRAKDTR